MSRQGFGWHFGGLGFLGFWRVLFGPVAGGGEDREGPLVVEGKLL
jgi:hypothetical protein